MAHRRLLSRALKKCPEASWSANHVKLGAVKVMFSARADNSRPSSTPILIPKAATRCGAERGNASRRLLTRTPFYPLAFLISPVDMSGEYLYKRQARSQSPSHTLWLRQEATNSPSSLTSTRFKNGHDSDYYPRWLREGRRGRQSRSMSLNVFHSINEL